jgi:hypothetical protein
MVNLIRSVERGIRRRIRRSALVRTAERDVEAGYQLAEQQLSDVTGAAESLFEAGGEALVDEAAGWAAAGAEVAEAAGAIVAPEAVAALAVGTYAAKKGYDYTNELITARARKMRKKNSGAPESTAQAPQEPGSRRTPRRAGPADSPPPPPMPPRGVSKSTHWYDRTKKKWIKRKRPLRKRASMRKKPLKKRAKKRTVKKTVKRKYMRSTASTKYNTYGLVSRHDVSYFGFAANGGRDEFLHAAADAVLRAWAGKFHIPVITPNANWAYGSTAANVPQSYKIYYRTHTYGSPGEAYTFTQGTGRNLKGSNHEDMVNALAIELRENAKLGRMPYFASLYAGLNATGAIQLEEQKIGDMMINIVSTMSVKLRNVTHPDGGDGDLTSVAKNPLVGYAYQFKGEVPLPKESLITNKPILQRFYHRDNDRGVCFGPQAKPSDTTDTYGRDDGDGQNSPNHEDPGSAAENKSPFIANDYMHDPPPGSAIFNNLKKSTKVVMPVGTEFKHTFKAAYRGTLAQFMLKYYDQFRPSHIGTCFWLGLKQKFRNKSSVTHAGVADTSGHDDVSVEYDVETIIRSGARMARADKTPTEVKVLALNNIYTGE